VTCETCMLIDPQLSGRENALRIGISERSARRHKAHMRDQVDPFFSDVPTAIITSRGKTVRLEDGSYEKVTYQPARKALLDSLAYDDLERAIEGYKPQKHKGKSGKHAATLHAADWQIGKAQQRGGGSQGVADRVMQSFHTFAALCKDRKPRQIVLSDNGDIIENIFNTPAQLSTNDLSPDAQIRTARRLMIEGIKILAPLAPEFYYVSIPSNHGSVRSAYKTAPYSPDADYGLEISYQLEDVCKEHKSSVLRDVQFVRPESMYETAVIDVANTRLAYHHGHQASNKKQTDWWADQDHGRMPGWDADILVTAHYHTMSVEQSGNGRWKIGVSSPEPGSDWFTNRTGEQSLKGLTTFDVLDGQWFNLAIV
jgi:hypothetical protein